MPNTDSRSVSARVNNQIADRFTAIAESRGYTTAGLIVDFVQKTVDGMDVTLAAPEPAGANEDAVPEGIPAHVSRLYGIALALVDDMMEVGYPDCEIENAIAGVRREMLP